MIKSLTQQIKQFWEKLNRDSEKSGEMTTDWGIPLIFLCEFVRRLVCSHRQDFADISEQQGRSCMWKFEIRMSKFEANSKLEIQMFKTSPSSARDVSVSVISDFSHLIVFLISDLDTQPTWNLFGKMIDGKMIKIIANFDSGYAGLG